MSSSSSSPSEETELTDTAYDILKVLSKDADFIYDRAVFSELNIYENNNSDSTNISNNSFEKNFEIIKNFDKTTQSYIDIMTRETLLLVLPSFGI